MTKKDESGVCYSNRHKITVLIGKIIRHMRYNPEAIKLVKIPNIKRKRGSVQYRGYYCPDDETVEIDYRYEVIPTLIHEYIHHFHYNWSESKVEKEERCIMAVISKKQATKLLKALARILPD